MKIKVCGLRDAENLNQVAALNPDFIGFIFYDQSPRFVGEMLDEKVVKALPRSIRKVGVFVNASPDYILIHLTTWLKVFGIGAQIFIAAPR